MAADEARRPARPESCGAASGPGLRQRPAPATGETGGSVARKPATAPDPVPSGLDPASSGGGSAASLVSRAQLLEGPRPAFAGPAPRDCGSAARPPEPAPTRPCRLPFQASVLALVGPGRRRRPGSGPRSPPSSRRARMLPKPPPSPAWRFRVRSRSPESEQAFSHLRIVAGVFEVDARYGYSPPQLPKSLRSSASCAGCEPGRPPRAARCPLDAVPTTPNVCSAKKAGPAWTWTIGRYSRPGLHRHGSAAGVRSSPLSATTRLQCRNRVCAVVDVTILPASFVARRPPGSHDRAVSPTRRLRQEVRLQPRRLWLSTYEAVRLRAAARDRRAMRVSAPSAA